jgi:hypothetical protein
VARSGGVLAGNADDQDFRHSQAAGIQALAIMANTTEMPVIVGAPDVLPVPPVPSVSPVQPAQPGRHRQHRRQPRWARLMTFRWLLAGTLTVQAALSLRLVWSNTAFQDEALYLWAGRTEWTHWLDGASIRSFDFPGYFSGAPVIYPPLGALADTYAGLAGARLLSLAFMLGATMLLASMTRRLYGRKAALFAAALFAGAGSAEFLGAFATYDAMALFLLSAATWLAVKGADQPRLMRRVATYLLAGGLLALANATKYAAALFDPVVLGMAFLAAWRTSGIRRSISCTAVMAGVAALLIAIGIRLGGAIYWRGITLTTLARSSGNVPAIGVLFISGKWIGAIAFLGVCGAATALWSRRWPDRLIGLLLATAVFMAPAEEARIHVLTSLFKHVGFGAWFACAAAGYALAALSRAVSKSKVAAAEKVAVGTVVLASVSGVVYATAHFTAWPNVSSSGYISALRPWVAGERGPVLIDDAQIPEFYLQLFSNADQITNSSYFAYTDPSTGRRLTSPPAAYADAIRNRYFSVISLVYGNSPTVYDPGIMADIRTYGGYRLVSSIPYRTSSDSGHFLIWVRTP